MAGSKLRPILVALLALLPAGYEGQAQQPPPNAPSAYLKRFEYKYSFKPPYLAQKDGTVPFFTYSGNAIASEESVRITPSLRSQKGRIWSKVQTTFDWWEVEVHFRVTGRGRIGADGLAFWYTTTQGQEGPVFGSSDRWNGLGIFFDSFDNDNKHNNPYIMAIVNDGQKVYDHQNDGSTQQLGGCLRDFRNKPFPVKTKIEYYKNILTVLVHNGMSNNDRDFELCLRVENVFLPKNGFYGISAATGGLADDHDVIKFSTSSLSPPDVAPPAPAADADTQKFEQEFEDYQKKLKEQKDQWKKENPDKVKEDPDDWDQWFSEQDKELQQIFQGQSDIKSQVNQLTAKLDEIIGRQDRTLSVIAGIQAGGAVAQPGGAPPPAGGGIPVDTIRRDEVNAVLANQREIVSASRDIKNFVIDIHSKTGQILARPQGSAQPIGQGQPGQAAQVAGPDLTRPIQEMRDSLNAVRRDMQATAQKLSQQQPVKCPEVQAVGGGGSCVTTTVLVGMMFVQLIILISYMWWRDSKEAQAKKFY